MVLELKSKEDRLLKVALADTRAAQKTVSYSEEIRSRLDTLHFGLLDITHDVSVERLNVDPLVEQVGRYLQNREEHTTLPFMIGYGGPSAGGKTTSCHSAKTQFEAHLTHLGLSKPSHVIDFAHAISMDGFYKDKADAKRTLGMNRFLAEHDMDTPGSWHMEHFIDAILRLKRGEPVLTRHYDYVISKAVQGDTPIPLAALYLFEGNHVLSGQHFAHTGHPLHDLFDLKVYAHTHPEMMDERWGQRVRQNRDVGVEDWALDQFLGNVVRARKDHVEPTLQNAHIVLDTRHGEAAMNQTQGKLARLLLQAIY